MIDWRDQGVLLAVRKHGETSVIIEVFTPMQGRAAGIVRGGAGRRLGPILQPGAQLDVEWKARLEAHLGSFTVEPVRSRAALVMSERQALEGLSAVCSLLSVCLPEREPHAALYERTVDLLDLLAGQFIRNDYDVRWLIRTIALTDTYQRKIQSAEAGATP